MPARVNLTNDLTETTSFLVLGNEGSSVESALAAAREARLEGKGNPDVLEDTANYRKEAYLADPDEDFQEMTEDEVQVLVIEDLLESSRQSDYCALERTDQEIHIRGEEGSPGQWRVFAALDNAGKGVQLYELILSSIKVLPGGYQATGVSTAKEEKTLKFKFLRQVRRMETINPRISVLADPDNPER